jgi:hypothetical protein
MTDAPTKANPEPCAPEDQQRLAYASAIVMAVVVAYGLHALFISGPAIQADAQAQLEQTIAAEDSHVCGQFGIRPGTKQSVVCSRELANVRQKQVDRDRAAAVGLL